MIEFYGKGKEQVVGRWIRAARGLENGTLELLRGHPKVKGTYIWDNPFLVHSQTRSRDRLGSHFASDALRLLAEHESELTASAFTSKVTSGRSGSDAGRRLIDG
jgi:hypothetical protein